MNPLPNVVLVAALIGCASGVRVSTPSNPEKDFWPFALGSAQEGSTKLLAPPNFSAALKWSWHHPGGRYHTTIAGGPAIDASKNLYLSTNDAIRKYSPDGTTLWEYTPPGDTNIPPALEADVLFGNTANGYTYALDTKTGKELWVKKVAKNAAGDVGYPGVYDGVRVIGVDAGEYPGHEGGNTRILGLDAKTGDQLWQFKPEYPSWNFMPIFGDDDSFIFMDFTGGVYKIGTHTGTQIWHTMAHDNHRLLGVSFSDGGVTVGDGMAFTCSNPKSMTGNEGTQGALRAYDVNDGVLLWEKILPQPCNSWPAVGRLGSSPKKSVVVTPGSFMTSAHVMHGGIMAFDASTGELQWKWQAHPYSHIGDMAVGDLEGYRERTQAGAHSICLPAHWGAPIITGDGAILASRSDGILYKLRGPDPAKVKPEGGDTSALRTNYRTSPGVVVEDKFNAHGASLHGAIAMAPGMLAFATCTDNLFVFKY